jgi:hypothetical protein
MIQRAIDDEVAAGISREDLDLWPPRVRNPKLCQRLVDRKLIAQPDQISDRAFRRFFTGR